jgi:hypothetical protein
MVFKVLKEYLFNDAEEFLEARMLLLSKNTLKTKVEISNKNDIGQQIKLAIYYLICMIILLLEFVLLYDLFTPFL